MKQEQTNRSRRRRFSRPSVLAVALTSALAAGTTVLVSTGPVSATGTSSATVGTSASSASTTTTAPTTTTTTVAGSDCTGSLRGAAFGREGWVATSNAPSSKDDAPANALDGDLATRFSTNEPQQAGLYFEVDLGASLAINAISMESPGSPTDYARGYQVQVSSNGTSWTTVAACTGKATPEIVTFKAQYAHFVKVVLDERTTSVWWSIDELNLYGGPVITSPASLNVASGQASSFTITTTGSPVPVITESGTLPPGLVFKSYDNGTATISGSPPSDATGSYGVSIIASNGVGSNAVQHLDITLGNGPVITSPATLTVPIGRASTFTITATGSPVPTLTEAGTLPPGLVFTANNNGTATISGTPSANTKGTYEVSITASNGVGKPAVQYLVITLGNGPVITSPANLNLPSGRAGLFTITATGIPVPTLSESGTLPPGLVFTANNNGTATISGTPPANTKGSYEVSITASNGVGTPVVQHLVITVAPAVAPVTTEYVSVVAAPRGHGYYAVTSAGNVYNRQGARFYGSTARHHLSSPISAFALTLNGKGYWLVTEGGDVYAFGDARVYGSPTLKIAVRRAVAILPASNGQGYYIISSAGNVYNYGGARFYGSQAHTHLGSSIVAAALTNGGRGYYFITARGVIYSHGSAHFYGLRPSYQLGAAVVSIDVTNNSKGYMVVTSKGNVYNFGNAHFYGSTARTHLIAAVSAAAFTPDGKGYWFLTQSGQIYAFGDARI